MSVIAREKDKGSGEYWIFVNHNGHRTSKKIGSRVQAEKYATILAGKLAGGDLKVEDLNQTTHNFMYYLQCWVDKGMPVKKAGGLRQSTRDDYSASIRKYIAGTKLANTPVDRIKTTTVELFLNNIRKRKAQSTTDHVKILLSHGFKEALKDEVITSNPCDNANVSRPIGEKDFEAQPFDSDELDQLLEVFRTEHDGYYWTMILFLIRTGCRIGETAAVTWDDVKFDKRYVVVNKTYSRGQEGKTKNGKFRHVDLTPKMIEALRELKIKTRGNLVFQSPQGGYMNFANFRPQVWYPTLLKHSMRRTRLHDMRHSCGSLITKRTQDIFYTMKHLGHSTIQMTIDRYGHLLDRDSDKLPVDLLDESKDGTNDR